MRRCTHLWPLGGGFRTFGRPSRSDTGPVAPAAHAATAASPSSKYGSSARQVRQPGVVPVPTDALRAVRQQLHPRADAPLAPLVERAAVDPEGSEDVGDGRATRGGGASRCAGGRPCSCSRGAPCGADDGARVSRIQGHLPRRGEEHTNSGEQWRLVSSPWPARVASTSQAPVLRTFSQVRSSEEGSPSGRWRRS
jgi:hypothetical protein